MKPMLTYISAEPVIHGVLKIVWSDGAESPRQLAEKQAQLLLTS